MLGGKKKIKRKQKKQKQCERDTVTEKTRSQKIK